MIMALNWSGTKSHYLIKMADGEEIDVTTSVIDSIAWERNNKRPYLDASGTMAYEQMLWTAWAAARRQGKTKHGTFNDFFPKVDDFAMVTEDEDDQGTGPDPTNVGASPG
jgi:hypothetical protein